MNPIRNEIHHLVDALPEARIPLVKQLLEALLPGRQDEDTEPLTKEDLADIHEARAEYKRGEFLRWEDVKKELRKLDAEEDADRG